MKPFSSMMCTAAACCGLALAASSCQNSEALKASNTPGITMVCKGGTLSACPRDAQLQFKVNGLSGDFFLSALLQNVATGEAAWLAPNAEDDPTRVSVHAGEQLLKQTVPMGLLSQGTYRVRVLLTQEALTRNDVLTAKIVSAAENTTQLTVTRSSGRVHGAFE